MSTSDRLDTNYEELVASIHPKDLGMRPRRTAKERRASAGKERITIRLDREVVDEFRTLAEDGSYQALINQALRDWLTAQSVSAMVRDEVRLALQATSRSAQQAQQGPAK